MSMERDVWRLKPVWMYIWFMLFPVLAVLYVILITNPFTLLSTTYVDSMSLQRATLYSIITLNITMLFVLAEITTFYAIWVSKGHR